MGGKNKAGKGNSTRRGRVGPIAPSNATRGFWALVWDDFHPKLRVIVVDFLTCFSLWFFLWLFHFIPTIFSIEGEFARFMVDLHSVGMVVAFAVFIGLFLLHVLEFKGDGSDKS